MWLCDRVVNVPLQYIAKDLGFAGNALIQGTLSLSLSYLLVWSWLESFIVYVIGLVRLT
jgi:hypothetical protein